MERDPVLSAIDNEYLEAIAETMRLGRRRAKLPLSEEGGPSLLSLLRSPELRPHQRVEEAVEVER